MIFHILTAMVAKFQAKGMDRADAEVVVNKMAKYENIFVNFMISEELGSQFNEDSDISLILDAVAMFFSHAIFGSLPIVSYFLVLLEIPQDVTFSFNLSFAIFILLLLGISKSRLSSTHWMYSAIEAIALGSICSMIAYGTSSFTVYILESM